MSDPYSDPARQLSRLIAAMRRQWQEELGGAEAPATEAAMHRAHTVLTAIDKGTLTATLAGGTVEAYIGHDWIENNPWARPHILRITTLLGQFPDH